MFNRKSHMSVKCEYSDASIQMRPPPHPRTHTGGLNQIIQIATYNIHGDSDVTHIDKMQCHTTIQKIYY